MTTERNQYNGFRFSQKVEGQERKVVAAVIAEALGEQVRYTGAPGFAYAAGGWTVDRDGAVHSPALLFEEIGRIRPVIAALHTAGLQASGNMALTLTAGEYGEAAVGNLGNLLTSKGALIKKALGIDGDLTLTAENGGIILSFYNATLNADELQAYIALAWRLHELAKSQRRVSPVEKPVENEKYAFRCFLLRLGFIGEGFKNERKVLLGRLEGNGAYAKRGQQDVTGATDEGI